MADDQSMRGWPASLVEVAELIGVAPTLKLVDAWGGIGCYVPKDLAPDHPLVQAIGIEAAAILAHHYGGSKIDVPILAVARQRKRLIVEADGRTSEVARRFGVTARWVRALRSRAPDARQLDMFSEPSKAD